MILIEEKDVAPAAGHDARDGPDAELPPPAYDQIQHGDEQRVASTSRSGQTSAHAQSYQGYLSPTQVPSGSPQSPASSSPWRSQSQNGFHVVNASYSDLSTHSSPHPDVYNVISPAPSSAPATPQSPSAARTSLSPYAPGQSNMLSFRRPITPGESIAVLLDPPPQSFQRSPSPDVLYPPFETTALMGISGNLSSAFPFVAPPSTAVPHPFATHDVSEIDWMTFVRDVKAASSLSSSGSLMAGVAPLTTRLPLLGPFIRLGIDLGWKGRQTGPAGELIDYWNYHFFHPRRIHIALARGSVSFSGPDSPPPDRPNVPEPDILPQSPNSKSGNAVDADYTDWRHAKSATKKGLKAAEKERKANEKLRDAQRKVDLHFAADEPWRLVVAYHP